MTRDEMKLEAWVCVLNDNETFTGLDGCWIAMTPADCVADLDDGGAAEDVPQPHYSLKSLLEFAIDQGYFDE
jgi:hypothetical protein